MRALIVDGYNALHAWPEFGGLMARAQLEDARRRLTGMLADYAAASGIDVTVVFDSHHRAGPEQIDSVDGITVRYGSAAASADHVIERLAYRATRHGLAHDIIVATSDRLQRELVIAMGVGVMTTLELCVEVQRTLGATRRHADERRREATLSNRVEDRLDPSIRATLEAMRRGRRPETPADDPDGTDTSTEPDRPAAGGPGDPGGDRR